MVEDCQSEVKQHRKKPSSLDHLLQESISLKVATLPLEAALGPKIDSKAQKSIKKEILHRSSGATTTSNNTSSLKNQISNKSSFLDQNSDKNHPFIDLKNKDGLSAANKIQEAQIHQPVSSSIPETNPNLKKAQKGGKSGKGEKKTNSFKNPKKSTKKSAKVPTQSPSISKEPKRVKPTPINLEIKPKHKNSAEESDLSFFNKSEQNPSYMDNWDESCKGSLRLDNIPIRLRGLLPDDHEMSQEVIIEPAGGPKSGKNGKKHPLKKNLELGDLMGQVRVSDSSGAQEVEESLAGANSFIVQDFEFGKKNVFSFSVKKPFLGDGPNSAGLKGKKVQMKVQENALKPNIEPKREPEAQKAPKVEKTEKNAKLEEKRATKTKAVHKAPLFRKKHRSRTVSPKVERRTPKQSSKIENSGKKVIKKLMLKKDAKGQGPQTPSFQAIQLAPQKAQDIKNQLKINLNINKIENLLQLSEPPKIAKTDRSGVSKAQKSPSNAQGVQEHALPFRKHRFSHCSPTKPRNPKTAFQENSGHQSALNHSNVVLKTSETASLIQRRDSQVKIIQKCKSSLKFTPGKPAQIYSKNGLTGLPFSRTMTQNQLGSQNAAKKSQKMMNKIFGSILHSEPNWSSSRVMEQSKGDLGDGKQPQNASMVSAGARVKRMTSQPSKPNIKNGSQSSENWYSGGLHGSQKPQKTQNLAFYGGRKVKKSVTHTSQKVAKNVDRVDSSTGRRVPKLSQGLANIKNGQNGENGQVWLNKGFLSNRARNGAGGGRKAWGRELTSENRALTARGPNFEGLRPGNNTSKSPLNYVHGRVLNTSKSFNSVRAEQEGAQKPARPPRSSKKGNFRESGSGLGNPNKSHSGLRKGLGSLPKGLGGQQKTISGLNKSSGGLLAGGKSDQNLRFFGGSQATGAHSRPFPSFGKKFSANIDNLSSNLKRTRNSYKLNF